MGIQTFIGQSQRRLMYPQMAAFGLQYTDYSMYDVYRSPLKQLEIARIIEKRVPMDFSYVLDYGVVFVEALGMKLNRPLFDFPSTYEHTVRTIEDVRKLEPPDPKCSGLMAPYLEAIELIADEFDKPEMVALVGPFTLAGELAGVEHLARSVIKQPEFTRELIEFCTTIISDFSMEAMARGGKIIQVSEPTASIISPKAFHRFVTPYLKRIFNRIHQNNSWSALHICGKTNLYLHEMVETGAMVFSLDQIMNLGDVAERIPANIVITGNVDPVDILLTGSVSTVKRATQQLLESMQKVPMFMPSFGCDCIMATPEENILAYIDTVKNFTTAD
jgi:uroporphyrinogen decarboxylase